MVTTNTFDLNDLGEMNKRFLFLGIKVKFQYFQREFIREMKFVENEAIAMMSVLSLPDESLYNQENVAKAYYRRFNYYPIDGEFHKSFQEDWEKFWNNLVSQHGAQIPWHVIPGGKPPGVNGAWTWYYGNGHPPANVAVGTVLQSGSNALAGTNLNSGVNNLAGANSQSGSNALSGTNSNLGISATQTSYNQQAALATSGSNTNSGTNIHQGLSTHQGTNTGPSNYNGPISGSSSTVNTGNKKPVFIQGAVSNVGNAGSIYVP